MQTVTKERSSAETIRRARADNPKMRERDLAAVLGVSEAELVAAHCGVGAIRLEPRVADLLQGLGAVGEVMALTRNASAVHEKIGVYDRPIVGGRNALVLGADIDLRIFPGEWAHGFAVEKHDGDDIRRSLQFFDAAGEAVHKVHLRPASNLHAFLKLRDRLASDDQSAELEVTPRMRSEPRADADPVDREELRARWSAMTDVHQFFGILRALDLTRREALRAVGTDYAWPLDTDAVAALLRHAADQAVPIMCFVGNRGCIQIHSGPVAAIRPMGPWLNVMDPGFHLHLRLDHIHEAWAVRKPVAEGHVTSVEAFGADGELIIQFFGKRIEGEDENPEWRLLAENLPRLAATSAA